jgi:C-terminal binding protein
MTLALTRGISLLNSRLRDRQGDWIYTQTSTVWRLRGRVFGIVGLGRIGTAAALRAKSLGMDVAFYDAYVPDGRDKAIGVRRVETIEALLAEAHFISMRDLLHARFWRDRQNEARIVSGQYGTRRRRRRNCDSRCDRDRPTGRSRHRRAGTRAAERRPSVLRAWRDPKHPAYHRVIVNPHAAFYSDEGLQDMRIKGTEACRRALLGLALRNVVG